MKSDSSGPAQPTDGDAETDGDADTLGSSPSTLAEGDESSTVEIVEECLDPEVQNRLWLRAVVPLLQLRSHESDPSARVQLALDLMYIAACERVARILRSDLDATQS